MKEIEILIEVKDSKEKALAALEQFQSRGIKKTLDIYFVDPKRNDLKTDASGRLKNSFRIREKDGVCSIAYKTDYFDGDEWIYSDEFETIVDKIRQMESIIKHLGFEELIRVESEKHTFDTSGYEIVFEEVKDLGLFMEVEKLEQVTNEGVEETKKEIRTFIHNLPIKFGEEQNAGKPELMLRKISKK